MASVMWFRRDLRLTDNLALVAAAAEGPVVGLFVVDPALLANAGEPRLRFLRESLADLDAATGGSLVVRVGDPVDVVPAVAREAGARAVYCTKDFGPYGRRRDEAVSAVLRAAGLRLSGIGSPYAVDPGTLQTKTGGGFAVFGAYHRAWQRAPEPGASGVCATAWTALPSDEVSWPGVSLPERIGPTLPVGEAAAWRRWRHFAETTLDRYASARDVPADEDGTSRLSAHLHFGTLHPQSLIADLDDSPGAEAFARQLCWRDFYADVLFRLPHSAWHNLDRRFDALEVDTDDRALERFAAWCAGQTGYPLVDAGMRQLASTGWMHNRVRMVAASFLVKDLHLPWQWGARHFLSHLVDGDLASNNHGWQWVAGSGTDAAPYHRILNPDLQAQRFDPDGEYTRRWLGRGGTSVPLKIVDHAVERVEALRRRRSLA